MSVTRYRLVVSYVIITFIGSIALWSWLIPVATPWLWVPSVLTWLALTLGPAFFYRRRTRQHAIIGAAVQP